MADLGYGRGWLNDAAAASIRRIDAQIGHPLQITEAGRTWAQQNEHYQRYLREGWPIALRPGTSVHELGGAIDTNEGQRIVWLLEENGWRRTVYRNGVLVEPWHFEYFAHLDKRKNWSASTGAEDFNPTKPAPKKRKRKNMSNGVIYDNSGSDQDRRGAIVNLETGFFSQFSWFAPAYADAIAVGFGLEKAAPVSKGTFDRIKLDCAALASRLGKIEVKGDAPKA